MQFANFVILFSVATLLSACATAPGPAFTDVPPPIANKGDVYLYRTSAFYAVAQSFIVSVDDEVVGKLYDASYLALRLIPGTHTLTVKPGGLANVSNLDIQVRPGSTHFYQYNFQTTILSNAFFMGSSIEPRDRATALGDLQGLKRATTDLINLNVDGAFARIDDVDAVPGLTELGKKGYVAWLHKTKPRAFVVCEKGSWEATWGYPRDPSEPTDAAERALIHGKQHGKTNCKLYALNDRVVWTK
jgi:hypothetical protein